MINIKDYSEYINKYAIETNTSEMIHPEDFIFHFVINNPCFSKKEYAVRYYYKNGLDSTYLLENIITNICKLDINKIELLEFASGFGCLTRHLSKIIPVKHITSCDIHDKAVDFLASNFNVKKLLSAKNPADLIVSQKYDIVFALSFFSHVPKTTFKLWLEKLFSLVAKNGYLIFTTHGLTSKNKHINYAHFDDDGFFFKEQSDQKDLDTVDYGLTVSLPEFVFKNSLSIPNCEIHHFQAGFWWEHQDLYIFKKTE